MVLHELSVADKIRLPSLPHQVLARMGIVRQDSRLLCRECGDVVKTEIAYEGNDTWALLCSVCSAELALVDTDAVFQEMELPFTLEEDHARRDKKQLEQLSYEENFEQG